MARGSNGEHFIYPACLQAWLLLAAWLAVVVVTGLFATPLPLALSLGGLAVESAIFLCVVILATDRSEEQ